ncbi:putative non-specific serine/threonine protein kinase [Helianthus annuus]|nr:putative non-specific serine/threonine protein kinase [Helianthus annuus]
MVLIEFKRSVSDPSGVLSSWSESNSDICSWVGVSCGSNFWVVVASLIWFQVRLTKWNDHRMFF